MKPWIIGLCVTIVLVAVAERLAIMHYRHHLDQMNQLDAAPAPPLETRTPVPASGHAVPEGAPARPSAPGPEPAQAAGSNPLQRVAARPKRSADAAPLPIETQVAIGRSALAGVGIDPDAGAAWYQIINNSDIPAEARKDLIEDLNEDGFADPRHLTEDDLPLINQRIAIIEEIGPQALDDVNYAAFEEAYKDLLEMRTKLSQR